MQTGERKKNRSKVNIGALISEEVESDVVDFMMLLLVVGQY